MAYFRGGIFVSFRVATPYKRLTKGERVQGNGLRSPNAEIRNFTFTWPIQWVELLRQLKSKGIIQLPSGKLT